MPHVHANGLDLYYAQAGHGTPILWLQGLGADHRAWSAQLARFGEEYLCLAPDNRDVGHSGRWPSPYTMADMAADMAVLLRELDAAPAHVIGLSLGGAIAQHLALDAPDVVRSLCLVSSFARQSARQRELLLAWKEIYARVDVATFYRQANVWLFSDRFYEKPRNVDNLMRYTASGVAQEPAAFGRQVDAALGHDTRDRLQTVGVPALVVCGANDILAPPYLSAELAEAIPGAHLAVVPDAAHSVNLEHQREFTRLVRDFLHGVDAS
jgi:pimeloyl-ACP methyl ester carboxylesterase